MQWKQKHNPNSPVTTNVAGYATASVKKAESGITDLCWSDANVIHSSISAHSVKVQCGAMYNAMDNWIPVREDCIDIFKDDSRWTALLFFLSFLFQEGGVVSHALVGRLQFLEVIGASQ